MNEIVKLFDIPKDVLNDNERQRIVYSTDGMAPTVLPRSDSEKYLQTRSNYMEQKKFMDISRIKEDTEFMTSNTNGFEVGDLIVIQEKVDGSNASIIYDSEIDIHARNIILNT